MTASEIADECDLPRSTVYRKVELMVDAGLLQKQERGREAARYSLGFDEVLVTHEPGDLSLTISRPSQSASEQLSELWSEVRNETDSNR
ncbi:helix-turn-helix domain-containing protein (plasmid) [Haloferax sp. S1W]|uniref:helix-turn-helix domain-containing protein n=1 Tax=Haloferax sp. S1W TaxID=3377110 RepID=UPI0037CCB82E